MKTFSVVLIAGSDYTVKARTRADAIKKVKAGKGKRVGQYFCAVERISAREIKKEK